MIPGYGREIVAVEPGEIVGCIERRAECSARKLGHEEGSAFFGAIYPRFVNSPQSGGEIVLQG